MANRFRLRGTTYETVALDEISLLDLARFNQQAADDGIPFTWADVQQALVEVEDLDEAAAERHPMAPLLIGVTIWAARRAAGESGSVGELMDVRMSEVEFLPEPVQPEDHKGKAGARKGSKKPAKKASAPAAGRPAASAEPTPTT